MAEILHEQRAEHRGCRVHGVTVLLLWLSRLFGAAPVSFTRQRSLYIAHVSRRYAFIACVAAILIGVTTLTARLFALKTEMNAMNKSLQGFVVARLMISSFNYLLTTALLILAAFGGVGRMRRFMCYYIRIQKIHVGIENKPISKTLDKLLAVLLVGSVLIVLIACVAYVLLNTYIVLQLHMNLLLHVIHETMCVSHIISTSLVLQITFLDVSALWTLKYLNKCIKRLQRRIQCDGENRNDSSDLVDTIHRFTTSYASIFKICRRINSTEGYTMLLVIIDSTFHILAFVRYSNSTHIPDQSVYQYAQIVVEIWHFMRLVTLVLILVEPCHRTHGELQRTQVLISQLLCCPSSAGDSVSMALTRFYDATEPFKHVYTPMGTFRFSRSLYTALISVLTTQIVIFGNF